MAAPSYTFLMGEYVSVLKIIVASPKTDPNTRQFYQQRLDNLKALRLHDLPLYHAEQLAVSDAQKALFRKGLY
jgi:hypothetical protein